jgi:oligopeptidase A
MDNPLLDPQDHLPAFNSIRAEHVEPAIERVLAENRMQIAEILERGGPYTWENLVQALEELDDRLGRVWAPVAHLNAVVSTEELRETYNRCRPKISAYETDLSQNEALFRAYCSVAEDAERLRLGAAQRKLLTDVLRDFRLAGIELDGKRKARFKEIQAELTSLASQYQDNVLDATHGWTKHVQDKGELAGLPASALDLARHAAEQRDLEGFVLTLEIPSYIPLVAYADDRELRRELYEAFATRASDRGPQAGCWDNSEIMERILALRHESAHLLGFTSYAEYSLATKMAPSGDAVLSFLGDLARRSLSLARRELEEIKAYAREHHGATGLEVWDLPYYGEKLRQHKYAISQEDLRPYFPDTRVIPGLFAVAERLFGIRVEEHSGVETWHPEVRFFEIRDAAGDLRGQFYLDLYSRPGKRGGAWMGECRVRQRRGERIETPVAFLTCNFSPPVGGHPSLLTHQEVITLFHEFGHTLHHLLTRVDHRWISGINGVAWDAVELPSQFLENWCWEREALDLISGHYRSGEPLPDALLERMLAARHFEVGMQIVRQVEFALFDFRLHGEYEPARGGRIYEILEQVRDQVAVVRPPALNRFVHAFTHIFAGGYAAGYYSYKWAEVLSADAFSLFQENGIFDRSTALVFLHGILERGGSSDAMDLFREFRGRDPDATALLRHNGIVA